MIRFILAFGLLILVGLVGCSSSDYDSSGSPRGDTNRPSASADSQNDSVPGDEAGNTSIDDETMIDLRIGVYDDTEKRPLQSGILANGKQDNRIEFWVRGLGSWYPDLHSGGDVNTLGSFPVGEQQELFIYPDGRDGKEIRVLFRMTKEMNSGSA